jgi:hypothetical protein
MKILTFKRLIGLTVIGGVAYIHKQRGGEWTLSSIKDTIKHLWSSAASKLGPLKDELKDELMKAPAFDRTRTSAQQGAGSSSGEAGHGRGARGANPNEEHQGRPYGDYNKRKDDVGRH